MNLHRDFPAIAAVKSFGKIFQNNFAAGGKRGNSERTSHTTAAWC
jgi:hypothetical protein